MTRALLLAFSLLATPLLAADEKAKLESGCKPGESVPTFGVLDVTGKFKGKTLCYI